ncbi:TM7S3/TM198-like domain-containing protein [Archaeoglobus neptunius]|uniref:TM7S3/TM198-like domain-containing protein n=1 Tax=Archaeoglobus neptunius TaxID=2798580 RepID=UPI00192760B2|nr:DUF4203 domain-containing protein [Archaeoglobus neptunius]
MQPVELAEILTSQWTVLTSMIIVGLILCFVGYRIFRYYSAAIGFLVGELVGIYVVIEFYGNALIAILLSAIAGAILFGLVYELGVIVTGAAFGYFLGLYLLPNYPIYAYVLGGLFAFTNLFVERPLTVLITSVFGSAFVVLATQMAITGMHIYDVLNDPRLVLDLMVSNIFMDLLWFTLVLTGIITQFVLYKEERKEEG